MPKVCRTLRNGELDERGPSFRMRKHCSPEALSVLQKQHGALVSGWSRGGIVGPGLPAWFRQTLLELGLRHCDLGLCTVTLASLLLLGLEVPFLCKQE